jgi:hypothetical protein
MKYWSSPERSGDEGTANDRSQLRLAQEDRRLPAISPPLATQIGIPGGSNHRALALAANEMGLAAVQGPT